MPKTQGESKQINGIVIEHIFIQCPNCKTKYTIYYESTATKALREQLKKRIHELSNINNPKKLEQAKHNIIKKQKRLKKECAILEKKYSEYF